MMNFGDFLDMVHISTISNDIRVRIYLTNLAMTEELIYDRTGLQDDYITRAMMKYSVTHVVFSGYNCDIYLSGPIY